MYLLSIIFQNLTENLVEFFILNQGIQNVRSLNESLSKI